MSQSLPVMLSLKGRRILIVGGGSVALRRARALLSCQAEVTCVAPSIMSEIRQLYNMRCVERTWKPEDLEEIFLVIIATDHPAVNDSISRLAAEKGILVNRADLPEDGDITIPAHELLGPISMSVSTNGISAAASAMIRDELVTHLDPFWIEFLEVLRPWRDRIKQDVHDDDARQEMLRHMVGRKTLRIFREYGERELNRHLNTLLEDFKDESSVA